MAADRIAETRKGRRARNRRDWAQHAARLPEPFLPISTIKKIVFRGLDSSRCFLSQFAVFGAFAPFAILPSALTPGCPPSREGDRGGRASAQKTRTDAYKDEVRWLVAECDRAGTDKKTAPALVDSYSRPGSPLAARPGRRPEGPGAP